jgi:hypothetical protein
MLDIVTQISILVEKDVPESGTHNETDRKVKDKILEHTTLNAKLSSPALF